MFRGHQVKLAHPDAVFAGDRSAMEQGAVCHAFGQVFGLRQFGRVFLIHQQNCVKVPVSHMAQNGSGDGAVCDVCPGFLDSLGQA